MKTHLGIQRAYKYYVWHPSGGFEIRLCKIAFCNIFDTSEKRVRCAAQGSSNLQ
jgi:hypothetical protein